MVYRLPDYQLKCFIKKHEIQDALKCLRPQRHLQIIKSILQKQTEHVWNKKQIKRHERVMNNAHCVMLNYCLYVGNITTHI